MTALDKQFHGTKKGRGTRMGSYEHMNTVIDRSGSYIGHGEDTQHQTDTTANVPGVHFNTIAGNITQSELKRRPNTAHRASLTYVE
jgi:hypothetical protein